MNSLITQDRMELVDDLPLNIITERLQELFRHHIGRNYAIELPEIFKAVYGNMQINKYQFIYFTSKIHHAINHLKKKTDFFIVGERSNNAYIWYVLQDEDELELYQNEIDVRVEALKNMSAKAKLHVKEKRWRCL